MLSGSRVIIAVPDETIDFDDAVERVEAWLRVETGGLERLPPAPSVRRGTPSVRGWRVSVLIKGRPLRFDVTIGESFPFVPPRIELVDRPPFLTWPHVEENGRLCLATESVTYSPSDPVGVLANLLDLAVHLIEKCEAGDIEADFRSEVLSYWHWAADYQGPQIVSTCNADGPSRLVRVWWGKELGLVGDDDDAVRAWLRGRYGGHKAGHLRTSTAVLINLQRCLVPAEYPKRAADVYALAREAGVTHLLDQALAIVPDKLAVALSMDTINGTAIAGVVIPRPLPQRAVDRITKGFSGRPIPMGILSPRFFGSNPVLKASLERADAAWVHGRCQDDRFPSLRNAKVVILGCGSVGAPIAVALAQAGVGSMVLVDGETIAGANVGRHPLGMMSLRRSKATELRTKITSDLPHVRIDAIRNRVEEVVMGHPGVLDDASLIVSALGNWSAERMLDEWHRTAERKVPILYTWTEPRASAGHALTVFGPGSSLHQGFDETGLPRLRVTDWIGGDTKMHEPACGSVFEPYGPVELGFITALGAELALDTLLGMANSPTHRIWACSRRALERNGGSWSSAWRALSGFRDEGAFVTERPWSVETASQAQAA